MCAPVTAGSLFKFCSMLRYEFWEEPMMPISFQKLHNVASLTWNMH